MTAATAYRPERPLAALLEVRPELADIGTASHVAAIGVWSA